MSDNFASTEEYMDYTLSAPPGTVLAGGARYWVVFEVLTINNLYLRTTTSQTKTKFHRPSMAGALMTRDMPKTTLGGRADHGPSN